MSVADETDTSIVRFRIDRHGVSAWVVVSPCAGRPPAMGDCVLLRGDNEAVVEWVRHRSRGEGTEAWCIDVLPWCARFVIWWHLTQTSN